MNSADFNHLNKYQESSSSILSNLFVLKILKVLVVVVQHTIVIVFNSKKKNVSNDFFKGALKNFWVLFFNSVQRFHMHEHLCYFRFFLIKKFN